MYKSVQKYIRACEVCQRMTTATTSQAPLASLPIPDRCWQSISMDFLYSLPRDSHGCSGIVVFVDRFSKMVHIEPVKSTITSAQAATIFVNSVFRYHGLPRDIISDRDPRFTAKFWSKLFHLLGTKLKMSTTDHPQTDGQTERANRSILSILRSFCSDHPYQWSRYLPLVEFALNNTVHSSTGCTPFFVNGLHHPLVPAILHRRVPDFTPGESEDVLADASDVDDSDIILDVNDPLLIDNDSVPSSSSNPSLRYNLCHWKPVPLNVLSVPLNFLSVPLNFLTVPTSVMDPNSIIGVPSSDVPSCVNDIPLPVTDVTDISKDDSLFELYNRDGYLSSISSSAAICPPSKEHSTYEISSLKVQDVLDKYYAVLQYVKDRIALAQDKQKENADKHGRANHYVFKINDEVLLSTKGLPPRLVSMVAKKLQPRFIGPFKVVAKFGSSYKLDIPSSFKLHPTFYVGRLKPYLRHSSLTNDPPPSTLLPVASSLPTEPRQDSV